MFEYLQKLSLEAGMDRDRKRKREAQSKAYWLGHSMTRFQEGVARCEVCDMTIKMEEDGVRGDATVKHCIQQTLEILDETQEENKTKAFDDRLRTTCATASSSDRTTGKNGIGTFCLV
jgi:hypothetical protein